MIGTSEKRSQDAAEFDQKIKTLIVDIEGTTTSISFVKDTLFPYIRENLKVYLKSHWKEPEFVEDLTLLRKQAESDKENGVEGLVPIPAGTDDEEIYQAVLDNILWQMDIDRKTKALKQLQGHVMREGYMNGKLKGHVYDDVQPALKSWKHSGRQVYVYSSGSVAAQKLLFEFSEKGDLLELFSGHFDTDVGSKIEASSYSNIAKQLKCKGEEIMFLTDIPKEAMAAKEAGLHAVLVVRPGNAPLTDDDCHKFRVIKSFDDIVFEASAKRTKLSVNEPTSNTTVPNESSNMTSDMPMDVDDESCPKVSEGATLTSEPQEKSQNKSEVAVLQNGGVQKDDGEQKVESSSEKKVNKVLESERNVTEPKKESCGSDSVTSSKNAKTIKETNSEENKVKSPKKTENINKDADKVKTDVHDSGSSEEAQSVVETQKDKTAGGTEKKEIVESENEKMETDKCAGEKTGEQKEKIQISEEIKKTAETSETTKSVETAADTVTPEVAVNAKTDKSDTTATDSPNETKSVDSIVETKTADSSIKTKTVDSSEETKTAESDEPKTVQTANKDKSSDVGEEKTVDSPCENKKSVVETTSVNSKELKGVDVETTKEKNLETKVPEKVETKILEVSEEAKVSEVAEKAKKPAKAEDIKTIEIAEEVKVPELPEKSCAPELAEEVKASDGEVVTTEIAKEVKDSQVPDKLQTSEAPEGDKNIEIAEEVKVPEVSEKAKNVQLAEETNAPKVAENAKEEKEKETDNEVLASKTVELQTSKSMDEKMECENESKTDESTKQLKTTEPVEKNAPQVVGETKMEESGTEDSKNEKKINSDIPKKDSEISLKEKECKSLENAEEKKVVESQEKSIEKGSADEKSIKTTCPENGETDIDMETATPDNSDKNQKAENKTADKEVPMKEGEANDSSTKKDEAMETDGQGSETVDKDTPMDVESTEISSGNGDNVEKKKEGENVKDVESKTNGINNSHSASPAENDTNVKILDNDSIKLKKNEESEAKLITPPSAQS